jgi:hypothetical protein
MAGVDNKSETAIANLALGHLGISQEISNIDTDRSEEGLTVKRFFTTARDMAFRDLRCPFLTQFASLSLVEENPNSEWGFSYRYPSNCLFFRRILSGFRNDTRETRVPYKIASDSVGRLIYTDKALAECEYTRSGASLMLWPDDFILATSYLLASLIAPRLTRGDGVKLGDRALQMYELMKHTSDSNADAEEQLETPPEAESIRARE